MRREGWPVGPVQAFAALAILLCLSLYALTRAGLGPGREQGFSSCTVTVDDPGKDCRTIEREITVPLEDGVASIPGVVQVRSVSEYGRSRVTVIAAEGERREAVSPALRDAVQSVAEGFPSSAQKPRIVASALGHRPAYVAAVRSTRHGGAALRDLVEREVKSSFSRVEGAGEVDTGGGAAREVHVRVDEGTSVRRGLSTAEIAGQVARQVVLAPAGTLAAGRTRAVVSVAGRAASLGELSALPIRLPAGGALALGQLASVSDGLREPESVSRVDGSEAVVISVHSSGNANLVALSRRLREEAARWEREGLAFDVLLDRGRALESEARGILAALLQAVAVVTALLPLFVRRLRKILALAALLPVTGLVAAGALAAAGVSFDQYILCGLAVGIGTILDTGIIVSGQDGARQVRAVVPSLAASLATTLIVLVPLLFLDFAAAGIRQVAAAVGLLLVVSFAVDVLFLPAFFLDTTGRQVLLPARPAAGRLRQWRAGLRRASHRGVRLLHALVRFAARRPAAVLVAAASLTAGMAGALLLVGKDFSPPAGDGTIWGRVEYEPGASIESVDRRTLQLVRLLQGRPGIGTIESVARRSSAEIQVRFDPSRASRQEAAASMREAGERIPGGFLYLPDGDGRTGRGLEVAIRGDDEAMLRQLAREAAALLGAAPGVQQVVLNFKEPPAGLAVVVDRDRAAAAGIRTADAAAALRWALHGPVALKWIRADSEIDLRVMTGLVPGQGFSRRAMLGLTVRAPAGALVPLGTVARIVERPDPARIHRVDRQRTASLTVHPAGGSLEKRVRLVGSALRDLRLPPGYAVELDRDIRDLERSFRTLWAAFALAAVFVFIVLAGFGESLGSPVAVLAVLPPSLAVPVIAWAVLGQPLRVPVLVGFIMLSGMVVNNSILVVDAARARLASAPPSGRMTGRRGCREDVTAAVRAAIRGRIRPLLITSAVTIAGTVPMLFAPARQGGFMAGLAFVIAWGMLGSLAATILVVPALASAAPALLSAGAKGSGREGAQVG